MSKTNKRPAAASKKAAAVGEKRPQPDWLQNLSRQLRPLTDEALPPTPERLNQSQGPPRLLDKAQVCSITSVTYVTLWAWMRNGQFPRSRIVGGKSMWLSTEIEAWMQQLPVRPLKGDAPSEAA